MKSNNRFISLLFKYMGEEITSDINEYLNNIVNRNYYEFKSEEEVDEYFRDYIYKFYNNHTYSDVEHLRLYTGISYKDINAVLRRNWNYELNGKYSEERVNEIYGLINKLDNVMTNLDSISRDIKVYRGVNIDTFRNYDVHTIDDFLKLKGDFLYDDGYSSTSLIKGNSYFGRDLEYHNECNIMIEYCIPKECDDGICLITDELSFSKQQYEYLLNRGALSKILDVSISEDKKNACLKVIYIPQRVWNIDKYMGNSKSRLI